MGSVQVAQFKIVVFLWMTGLLVAWGFTPWILLKGLAEEEEEMEFFLLGWMLQIYYLFHFGGLLSSFVFPLTVVLHSGGMTGYD